RPDRRQLMSTEPFRGIDGREVHPEVMPSQDIDAHLERVGAWRQANPELAEMWADAWSNAWAEAEQLRAAQDAEQLDQLEAPGVQTWTIRREKTREPRRRSSAVW